MNGGRCIGPNRCACVYGFTGQRCEAGKLMIRTTTIARAWLYTIIEGDIRGMKICCLGCLFWFVSFGEMVIY